MKINKISAELVAPPNMDRLRVNLLVDSGHSGTAEVFLPGRVPALMARLAEVVKALIGTDPFDTEALVDRLLTRAPGTVGDVDAVAVSMVEIACRDLVGRSLGVPVYRLLGGAVRDRIAACAVGWLPIDHNADAVSRAARAVVGHGFRALALSTFESGNPAQPPTPSTFRAAVRLAEVVRAAVGPEVALRIDLNARFNAATAIRFVRSLDRIEPITVADPIRPDLLPLADGVSIVAGHRLNLRDEFFRVLARRGCDTIRLDLGRCGGYTEAKKIAALAESCDATVSLRNLSSPSITAASLHLAATLTNLAYVEIDAGSLPTPDLIDGALPLPSGPGAGDATCEAVEVQS